MSYNTIREKILMVLRDEYLLGLNSVNKKGNNHEEGLTSKSLGFSDITVWFFKRNCQGSLSEAKTIWDQLAEKAPGRHLLMDFLEKYSDEIIETYKSFTQKSTTLHQIESILQDTNQLLNSINQNNEQETVNGNKREKNPIISIYLESISGHDLNPVFSNPSLIGHQIEIGEGKNISQSNVEGTNGAQVDFNEMIHYEFPLKTVLTRIALYEVYSNDGVVSKKLTAEKNINLLCSQLVQAQGLTREVGLSTDLKNCSQCCLGEKINSDESVKLRIRATIGKENQSEAIRKILNERVKVLQSKLQKKHRKIIELQQKLMRLISPFQDSIAISQEKISIIEKHKVKKSGQNDRCSIF